MSSGGLPSDLSPVKVREIHKTRSITALDQALVSWCCPAVVVGLHVAAVKKLHVSLIRPVIQIYFFQTSLVSK